MFIYTYRCIGVIITTTMFRYVDDIMVVLGIRDHNVGNYPGPYNTWKASVACSLWVVSPK